MNASSGTNNITPELKKKRGRPKKVQNQPMPFFSGFNHEPEATSTITVAKVKKKAKKTRKKWTRKAKPAAAELVAVNPPQPSLEVKLTSEKTEPQSRFTVKELVDIIRIGHESNLSEFRYLGLVLSFDNGRTYGRVAKPDQPKTFSKTPGSQASEQSSTQSTPDIQGWNQTASDEMADTSRMLEDPMGHEQEVCDRMLRENAVNEGEIS